MTEQQRAKNRSEKRSNGQRPWVPGRLKALAVLLCLLAAGPGALAETWQDERYPLSMRAPNGWFAMDQALLANANASVNHITGRGYIAGYSLHQGNTLLFPYMLVQYKPFTGPFEPLRPTHRLDERGMLELICNMIPPFGHRGSLPEDIDAPTFIDRYGNQHAQLTRLEVNGRFDFTGKIPNEQDDKPIRYHTHAVIGKDGVAMVSIFTDETLGDLSQIISEEMRTLRFENDFSYAALPDAPPTPEPGTTDDDNTNEAEAASAAPEQASEQTDNQAGNKAEDASDEADGQTAEAPAPRPDSTVLILIVGLLAVGFVIVAGLVWLINHKKSQEKKARARARRLRAQSSQGTTPTNNGSPQRTPPQASTPKARPERPATPRDR